MLTCKKCGADLSNGQVQSGISKDKTLPDGTFRAGGKPYKYVQCNCGGREFLPYGVSEKKPVPQQAVPAPAANQATATKLFSEMYQLCMNIDKKVTEIQRTLDVMKACNDVGGTEVKDPGDIVWQE